MKAVMPIIYILVGVVLFVLVMTAFGWNHTTKGNFNLGEAYEASTRAVAMEAKYSANCTSTKQTVEVGPSNPTLELEGCTGRYWSVQHGAGHGIVKVDANYGAMTKIFSGPGDIDFSELPHLNQLDFRWISGPPVQIHFSYPS